MKVTKAKALGTCFGVQEALKLALESNHKNDLTILGELVHNSQIVKRLKDANIKIVSSLNEPIRTKHVMITAHGASDKLKEKAKSMGFIVEDASCPLVMRVHKVIKEMVAQGYFPVVIGQIDHVEVKGIIGDLEKYEVINSIDEIDKLKNIPRIGIVSQTTQQIKTVREIVKAIKLQKHKEVKFVDTICKPTKDRQKAVEDLCKKVDIMIVIGGHNSSNTKKLKLVCENKGLPVYQIEKKEDINPQWFKGHKHVGITAGTSTPSDIIEDVYQYLLQL